MSLRFETITIDNVDDLMSVCGNMPGLDKNPQFQEGRKARRAWLLEMMEKFGTVGMLAYGSDGTAKGFVECIPASAHPLGVFSPDVKRTVVIDCAWYRQSPLLKDEEVQADAEPIGLAIRKAILDEMFATKFFDRLLDKKCRYVDVLTLKGAPIMQYDFYEDYGFKEAIQFTGHATIRYLLRYPVLGDDVKPMVEQVNFNCEEGKNVLVLGMYRQCHIPAMIIGKVTKAVEGIEGLTVKVADYWDTGMPVLCEPVINDKPAFDGPVFFMSDEDIRDSVKSKMV